MPQTSKNVASEDEKTKTVINDDANTSNDESKTQNRKATSSRRGLSMAVVNFWLDCTLLLVTVFLGAVSVILRLVFPAPTQSAGWKLWGWNLDQWYDVQFACLCLLGIGVLIHITLHWNWVCGVVATQILKSRSRIPESMKTIYGVAILILLLHLVAAAVIAAMFCVERPMKT